MPGDKNDNAITRQIIIGVIIICVLGFLYGYYMIYYLPLSKFKSIKTGMSIAEVHKKLGNPYKVTTKNEKLDTIHYNPVPKIKNRNLVLIYDDKWDRAYIFIDEYNKVFAIVISVW